MLIRYESSLRSSTAIAPAAKIDLTSWHPLLSNGKKLATNACSFRHTAPERAIGRDTRNLFVTGLWQFVKIEGTSAARRTQFPASFDL
ncbi:MAG TPA: hypothetical protein VFS24_11590 [Steroidobacteraceae bacterium]|nr:hypothetical protein [Steroidobacteraceae bacterium]